jgi:hypothetical protein
MDPRKQLLAAVGALVVGLGASSADAKSVVTHHATHSATANNNDLCRLANTALRAGDQHSLQLALGHFPSNGKLSKRAQLCKEQLASALVELTLPASGPTDTTPAAPAGNKGGGSGSTGGGNHYG